MVYNRKSWKFEDLDFNLVRDLWKLFLRYPHSCWSMEELVIDMKKLGYGDNKVRATVRVLARDDLVFPSSTRVYRNVKMDKNVRGKIIVYQYCHVMNEFIQKFLSFCESDKDEKGGMGKTE